MLTETSKKIERALLIGLSLGKTTLDEDLIELEQLVKSAGAIVIGAIMQNKDSANSATLLGKGKVEEIKNFILDNDINLVVCDNELSGSQTRNLTDFLECKVIDRSCLILDIFAKRATTLEGKLQVELAQLKYNLPRLVGVSGRMAKFGGGIGMRGPGEKKLEVDKRIIAKQIDDLTKRLTKLGEERDLRRAKRESSEIKTVSLVGYTNAGKSTIMNVLAKSHVLSEDKLFATLDPVTRRVYVDNDTEYLLTDTVGFVDKLPHEFINAFSSTLEEAKTADLLLHVLDASSQNLCVQYDVVLDVLNKLGIVDKNIITIYNKIDKASEFVAPTNQDVIEVSAKNGKNIDKLKELIISKLYN